MNTKVAVLNQFVLVTLLEDFTALETEETFHLKLKPRSPLQPSLEGVNVLFCDTIEITIFDRDCESIGSFEVNYIVKCIHFTCPSFSHWSRWLRNVRCTCIIIKMLGYDFSECFSYVMQRHTFCR